MKRIIVGVSTLSIFVAGLIGQPTSAADGIDISVIPAFAPVGPFSPSWEDYVSNAVGAIPLGVDNVGNISLDPSAYVAAGEAITPLDIVYTGGRGPSGDWFNSWHAQAPAPGAAFAGEYGNRLHFGLHIESEGTVDFALQDLAWKLDSNDSSNYFDQEGSFASANYSTTRVGINFGPDGTKGTGDDIVYDNNESGSLPVHELVYVGVGDGVFSSEPAISGQADIDATLADILSGCVGNPECSGFDFEGIYTLDLGEGADPLIGTNSVNVVIEPAFGGDLDHDGQIGSGDKDILTNALAGGGAYNILYDVDGNGALEFNDLDVLVHDIAGTTFGDANCDGIFNSSDLIQVFVEGKYETGASAVWSSGDWNADGIFSTTDLVLAFADGGYTSAATSAAVPEPSACVLAMLGMGALAMRRRR